MRILIDIGHPAHVHLFKNFIWIMKERGHEVLVTTRKKEMTTHLLDIYGIEYISFGEHRKTIVDKLKALPIFNFKLLQIARRFHPDIFLSHGSIYAAHVSALLNKPHISFEDTEHSTEQIMLYKPFTDVILTSTAFQTELGKKQIRYNGYHELAYLHPNYYKPDPSILDELGVRKEEMYVILRFVSWDASHDIGHSGMSFPGKWQVVKELSKFARVFISSEVKLTSDFEDYRIKIPLERIHDALFYAVLYIGEGATMASECAVLGTPAIYVNSLALGYTDDEEENYGLMFHFRDETGVVEKAVELLRKHDTKRKWYERSKRLLSEKIDVTRFIVDFVERYPPVGGKCGF